MAALFTTIYLGGWRGPGAVEYPILGLFYFFIKVFLVYFIFIWIRGTFPRVRIDQLLNFNWKFLVPLTLGLILIIAVVLKLIPEDTNPWVTAAILFTVNILVGLIALEIVRRYARQQRDEGETTSDRAGEVPDVQPTATVAS
jgi:NADH-quinone oxidoreductase subunit H